MNDYSSKTCCVVDNGLFVETAIRLSKFFGKVYYHSPWESSYPTSNETLVGYGLDGLTRVESIWPILDKVDLWVFPDVYSGDLQVYLESLGKRVWGSRKGEFLELDRLGSKELQEELGIRIGPYVAIKGLENLEEYLKDHENVYVKISKTRGDMETFYCKNFKMIEPKLDEIEYKLGAKAHIMDFIVEEAIYPAVEIGYDGYTVDGSYPNLAVLGIEVKDQCYIGQVGSYDLMPPQILDVNEKIAPYFKDVHYRNFCAFELRVTPDGTYYSIDPCMRQGSPPSEVLLELYGNIADIFWYGAEGICVDPEMTGKWAAMSLVKSDWARNNWQPLEFPKKIRDNIKLRYASKINGKYYVVPQGTECLEIAAVVAVGQTLDSAIEECKRMTAQVEGYYVQCHLDTFDEAKVELSKLKRQGYWLQKGSD